MRDLIIRNGTIVDGSGAEPYLGDVAIDGDRIVEVGKVEGTGRREIDATGRCVRAAPILKWCVGMGRDDLRAEFERRGYRATVVRRISSSASTATPNTSTDDGSGTLTA